MWRAFLKKRTKPSLFFSLCSFPPSNKKGLNKLKSDRENFGFGDLIRNELNINVYRDKEFCAKQGVLV